jgi:hypothetical protein
VATTTSYRCELLDKDEAPKGTLTGVTGGSLSYSVASTIKSQGNLRITYLPTTVDLLNDRVKVIITVNGADHPLGVFKMVVPETGYTTSGNEWDVELLDKLAILDEVSIPGIYTLPADTNIIAKVKELIEAAGETAVAITESDATLRGNVTWEEGTSRLRIINDLLEAANYFSLWCDGEGRYQATPHTDAQYRPLTHQFVDGANCRYSPTFTRSQDIWKIPNRFIAISRASEDEPAIIGIATNENPESKFSFQARGRWIDEVSSDVELADQAAADAYAARRLQEVSSAVATVTISHEWTPLLLNDAVRFARLPVPERHRIDARHVVQRMEVSLESAAFLTSTTLREVVSV